LAAAALMGAAASCRPIAERVQPDR
jgi:hypothetical protein